MKLKCKYNLYFTPGLEHKKNMTKEDFESKLQQVTSFETAEDFWDIFLLLKLPSELTLKSKIFIFKTDITPTWENKENQHGGRLFIKLPSSQETNINWQNIVLEFLSGFRNREYYNDLINGIELQKRHHDQISINLWTKIKEYRVIKDFFYKLKKSVPLPYFVEFDFSEHPIHNRKNNENQKKQQKLSGAQVQLKEYKNTSFFQMTQQIISILNNFSSQVQSIQNNYEKSTNQTAYLKKTFYNYYNSLTSIYKKLNISKNSSIRNTKKGESKKICIQKKKKNKVLGKTLKSKLDVNHSKKTIKKLNKSCFLQPKKLNQDIQDIILDINFNDFTLDEMQCFQETDIDKSINSSRILTGREFNMFSLEEPKHEKIEKLGFNQPTRIKKVNSIQNPIGNKFSIPLKPQNSVQQLQLLQKSISLKKKFF